MFPRPHLMLKILHEKEGLCLMKEGQKEGGQKNLQWGKTELGSPKRSEDQVPCLD